MNKRLVAAALLSFGAFACGGNSNSTTSPTPLVSASGTWSGTASDSTTPSLGNAGMMGQAGMGRMTWQLTQNGSKVSGTMSFSGMQAVMMLGTVSGTMSGADMAVTMDMPAGAMTAGSCSAHATGTMHIDGSTMTGAYSGTNSCAGPFTNGQMTMNRQ